MKFITNIPLSYLGGRVEKNTIIELTEEEAKAFDSADITPYAGDESSALETEPATTGDADEETQSDEVKAAVKPKSKASGK